MVELTKRFFGVRDGQVYPEWIEAGETVSGDLAAAAISSGCASGPSDIDEIQVKHAGGGRWWLVRGDERIKGPFPSKAEAEAAL